MFQTNIVQKIKTHILCSSFRENRAVYDIMRKNTVQPDRPQVTTQLGAHALHGR
jgi:hypothetical protein